jgi:nucleoid-associated protein YgaU
VQEYVSAPERRYPSPSAQRRSGEHWKARVGLGFVIVLTLCSAAVMFRIAGMGVGSAASTLRGPQAAPAATAAATARPGGAAPAATAPGAAVPAAPAPTTAPAQPTAAPSPTTRPGQREHTVAAGDTLSAIATRYNTTIAAIVAANNLPGSNTVLNIGQRLIIPA